MEQQHVIPTVSDRPSDICVHEQALSLLGAILVRVAGYREEERISSELISVTLFYTMSHSSRCGC